MFFMLNLSTAIEDVTNVRINSLAEVRWITAEDGYSILQKEGKQPNITIADERPKHLNREEPFQNCLYVSLERSV